MKTILSTLAIISLFVALLFSCSSDDNDNVNGNGNGNGDDPTPLKTNYLRIGETDYELWPTAIYIYYGEDEGNMDFQYEGHYYEIRLLTKGVTYQLVDGDFEYYGNGYGVSISLVCEGSPYVCERTYKLPVVSPYPIGSFGGTYHYKNGDNIYDYEIETGTFIVEDITDTTLEFSIDCSAENGNCVKTHFDGGVDVYTAVADAPQQKVIIKQK